MKQFFSLVLPQSEGWTPIILKGRNGGLTNYRWFHWPYEADSMVAYAEKNASKDVYFSPFLYVEPDRLDNPRWATKSHVIDCCVVWSDGDSMDINKLHVPPTVTVQTSSDHWQGYWIFSEEPSLSPQDYEGYSHALVNLHEYDGMDSGWALSKKMRVPGTTNTKYDEPFALTYLYNHLNDLTEAEFAVDYPQAIPLLVTEGNEEMPVEVRGIFDVLGDLQDAHITTLAFQELKSGEDRSAAMYYLECTLWEAGCSLEDVFAVMRGVSYNKFNDPNRGGDTALWRQLRNDYTRWKQQKSLELEASPDAPVEDLVSASRSQTAMGLQWSRVNFLHEGELAPENTFVDLFIRWASLKSKMAPEQFHVAGALALLSAIFARYGKIGLSFGDLPLNLYFLVLGRTTQSRKSTSLRLAQKIFWHLTRGELEQYIVPDDATPEALVAYLGAKPRESSQYVIDEVQDTFQAAAKKNGYMSGIIGFLTKSFDGQIPGVLRKTGETKMQKSVPHYLTFYGTGIMSVAANYLTTEKINTGFVPRCLIAVDDKAEFTLGADDVTLSTAASRRSKAAEAGEKAITSVVADAREHWSEVFKATQEFTLPHEDPRTPIGVSEEAFRRWKVFAKDATTLAAQHEMLAELVVPVVERMTFSTLKIAALLAMVERRDTVEMRHMLKAISFAHIWMPSTEVFVREVTSTGFSRDVDDMIKYVASCKDGICKFPQLLAAFQGRFNSTRQFLDALTYAQSRGMLREELVDKTPSGRRIVFSGA